MTWLKAILSTLEEVASKLNINKLQLEPSEKIFKFISTKEFKDTRNNMLRRIKIELLNKITKINNKNTKAILYIMLKYHYDPVEGGHWGIFRTAEKIKRYYYKKYDKRHS